MSKATAVYLLSTVAASASAKLLTPQDASSSTLAAAGITLHRDHAPGAVRCEELLVPMDDAGAALCGADGASDWGALLADPSS